MSLARVEHILADYRDSEIPDFVYEQVTCAGCGCVIPRDESERIDHRSWCSDCAPAARHYAALNARSDGASR